MNFTLINGYIIALIATFFVLFQVSLGKNPSTFMIFLFALPTVIIFDSNEKITRAMDESLPTQTLKTMFITTIVMYMLMSIIGSFYSSIIARFFVGTLTIVTIGIGSAMFALKYKKKSG